MSTQEHFVFMVQVIIVYIPLKLRLILIIMSINVFKHEYETDLNRPLIPVIQNIRNWPIWISNYVKLPINRPYMSYSNLAYMASRRNGGYNNRTLMCHSRHINGGYRGYFLLGMWLCCHIKLGITHGPNVPVWSLSISIVQLVSPNQTPACVNNFIISICIY